MRFDVLTIFPAMFDSYLDESLLKRALSKGLISVAVHDIRDFATDKHRKVDDTPSGGGAGMVMKVEPIWNALRALEISKIKNQKSKINTEESDHGSGSFPSNILHSPFSIPHSTPDIPQSRIILLSAKGKVFRQEDARRLSRYDRIVLICGRYEGVDERVSEHIADEELSIGEFVLTGGELPALVVMDAVARLVPGVLGNERSIETESYRTEGYLEYPQYTKPDVFNGWRVPSVLLSGNHAEIEKWRQEHASTPNNQETM